MIRISVTYKKCALATNVASGMLENRKCHTNAYHHLQYWPQRFYCHTLLFCNIWEAIPHLNCAYILYVYYIGLASYLIYFIVHNRILIKWNKEKISMRLYRFIYEHVCLLKLRQFIILSCKFGNIFYI